MKLILASSSPARQKLLQDSGICFETRISAADEDAALAQAQKSAYAAGLGDITPAQTALLLAKAKAQDVAAAAEPGSFVLGCDSVFEFDGLAYGKPHTEEKALERISAMSGKSGLLHTGHWLIAVRADGTVRESSSLRTATVHFATMAPEEITAYVATQEPLKVAGSFTIDGYGAAFIQGVEGEYHTIVGLSINALRAMLAELDQTIVNFWAKTH